MRNSKKKTERYRMNPDALNKYRDALSGLNPTPFNAPNAIQSTQKASVNLAAQPEKPCIIVMTAKNRLIISSVINYQAKVISL
jgi:hypothetical protein